MGTILTYLFPFRRVTAVTVITAMLLLLQSVHLYYSSLSAVCRYLPDGRLRTLFRCLFCSLQLPFGFCWLHTCTRSYEPLRPDTPRRDSCCHVRIISILSSPVRLVWWFTLCPGTFAALLAFSVAFALLSSRGCYTVWWLPLSDRQDGKVSQPAPVTDTSGPWSFCVRLWSLMLIRVIIKPFERTLMLQSDFLSLTW